MLILEGPDGVGKTTLAKKLLEWLPAHIYVHFTRLPPYWDYYWGYIDRMSPNIVQDRFHMSEIMYSVPNGRPLNPNPSEYRLIDAKLRLIGAMTVLITADKELVRERWGGNQMYNMDKTVEVAERYARYAEWTPKSGYDPDVDYHYHCTRSQPYVSDDCVREIIDHYRTRQERVAAIAARQRRPAHL